ncbi:MAG: hypothetical protein ACOCVM_04570 [Desulfovibrionaceae bacterium]
MIYAFLGSVLLLFFALFVMRKIMAWENAHIRSMKQRETELQQTVTSETKNKRSLSLELHELNNRLKLLEYRVDEEASR